MVQSEKDPYSKYNEAKKNTASKLKQVIMLYDTCIKHIKNYLALIGKGKIEEKYNFLNQASEIIEGLQASLDYDNGGEISKILEEYYTSIYMRIMHLHHKEDKQIAESIIKELQVMRNAWVAVDEGDTEEPELPELSKTIDGFDNKKGKDSSFSGSSGVSSIIA